MQKEDRNNHPKVETPIPPSISPFTNAKRGYISGLARCFANILAQFAEPNGVLSTSTEATAVNNIS